MRPPHPPITRCPLCGQFVETLLHRFKGPDELAIITKLEQRHRGWCHFQGLCERCFYLNEFDTLEEHFSSREHGSLFRLRLRNEFALLPTPLRLNADPRFRGAGVTIAFIDSGFYPHPDLVKPRNRIRAIVDMTDEHHPARYFRTPHIESWHGTMTSVASIGNGHLSKGLYRGIASEAEAVFIKVFDTRTGRINTENITRGLRWAIAHREEFNIRIINLSVGDDDPATLAESPVDQAAEEAVAKGIVVVAAAGNNPDRPIVPPASSPSVITVGGLDDRNELHEQYRSLYHSTSGTTLDGYVKPELIAPAIWVAGPVLPGTDQYRESGALFRLLNASPAGAGHIYARHACALANAPKGILKGDYKGWCRTRIREMNYIAPFYKHVDGTSFAAPIVSSVIAQMLEACPSLPPILVKRILTTTADPIKDVPREQQGFGVLNPRSAVQRAMLESGV